MPLHASKELAIKAAENSSKSTEEPTRLFLFKVEQP